MERRLAAILAADVVGFVRFLCPAVRSPLDIFVGPIWAAPQERSGTPRRHLGCGHLAAPGLSA